MLVANGVTYPIFAQALKRVFLQAAEQELQEQNRRITNSALSLLSGVHRKDVRTITAQPDQPLSKSSSLANDVVARWLTDRNFLDPQGQPRALNIRPVGTTADAPSFEHLAQSVSKDFHARSMLNELARLGVVAVDGNRVHLRPTSGFVPDQDVEETLRTSIENIRDRLTAIHTNLTALGADESPQPCSSCPPPKPGP